MTRAIWPWRRGADDLVHFTPAALADLAARGGEFQTAEPFPHCVLDDFFPSAVARRLEGEFPPLSALLAHREDDEPRRRGKWISTDEETLSGFTRHVLYELKSGGFVRFLERVSGIDGLIPDPEIGGALRHFERGGCLGVHADPNIHPRLKLDRRLNLIVYLTAGWRPEWNGHLELWDAAVTRCVRRIEPRYNRAVLFVATETSFHGFPEPLLCPPGITRRSLQLYYYTNGRPAAERAAPHSTVFRWRPGEEGG
jgi:hypothetical protein